MREAIEAARRRGIRGGNDGQHRVAVAGFTRSSAEDPFAVVPQHLEATVRTSAEPRGWIHFSDSAVNLTERSGVGHTALPARAARRIIDRRAVYRSPERVAIEPARDRARDLLGRVFRRVVSGGAEGDDVELGERAARPLD